MQALRKLWRYRCRFLGSVSIAIWPVAPVSGWHAAWGVLAAKLLLLAALPLALRLPFAPHVLVQTVCLAAMLYGCSRNCSELAAGGLDSSRTSTFVQLVQVRASSRPCHTA